MVKEAFKRLPIERRTAVMDSAMALYLEKPNDEITIRVLAAHLGINMATFYRWFDDKYDLCIEIARFICVKAAPTEPRHIFDEFDTSDVVTKREAEYMTRIVFCNDELRQRVFFDVDVDVYLPMVKQYLQLERLDGRLRDNVTDEFVAYLYVTMEYNLLRFMEYEGIRDMQLYVKLKDYLLHSLLPHGIMKEKQPLPEEKQ